MSWPAIRSGSDALRALVIATGLCWSVAFAAIALTYELQLYADGSMFSYAVAVQDVWAFHWHNISGRLSVFLLSLWPAEIYVGLSGNPGAGIVLYGLLFYLAPLAGLIATFAADRSRGRLIFVYACASTALLCPLVFGFPTEMWLAHALFWPALAVSHFAGRTVGGTAIVFLAMLTLAFAHEGALVLAIAIVATLAPRGWRDALFLRATAVLIAVLAIAAAAKIMLPPDEYFAEVLLRAALHFFDLSIFEVPIVLLLFAVLAGYGVVFQALSQLTPDRAYLYAALIVISALASYWLWFDHSVLASNRYYLRTALVIVTPAFGALAVLSTWPGNRQPAFPFQRLQRAMRAAQRWDTRPLAAVFIVLTLVHLVETAKFVTSWTSYRAAVAALATSNDSDPGLGDPRFVSSERISADLNRLSWFSTTPYLSVLVANFAPSRLVVDPAGNYFWLSCATATANSKAISATPAAGRELVRIYSCLHR
jgi:hypothetical protein